MTSAFNIAPPGYTGPEKPQDDPGYPEPSPARELSSARLRQVLALVQTLNSKPIVGVVPKEKEAAHERS